MPANWTKEQRRVIDLRNCNILVSAAAGSGKTAVLVERILSRVTDPEHPVDIDRLLIVTFTNAAAGEMRDRIRSALEERLEQETDPQRTDQLQRQISLLMNAQISTIHSFCQYVIRNYFHIISLDPDFRVADEGEQRLLQDDVLQKLLEERYAYGDSAFLHMVACAAAGRDDRRVEELVLQLYRFAESFPWPEDWLESCRRAYRTASPEEFLSQDWIASLTDTVRQQLEDLHNQVRTALELTRQPAGPYMYESALESDLERFEELLQTRSYGELGILLERQGKWKTLSGKKDETVDGDLRQQVKELRDQYKKALQQLREDFFYEPPEELQAQMASCAPFLEALLDLTEEFSLRFTEEKRSRNLCDFGDLEHLALQILVQRDGEERVLTAAALELAERYEEILIDEYQDSNLVQEMILTAVSGVSEGRHNLFMVGDVKQSIYRFRLARPELFMEKYETYSLESGPCVRVDLSRNFRSRRQVLDAVNALFERLMAKNMGNVVYDEAARLYPGAEYAQQENVSENAYQTELLLLDLADRGAAASDRKIMAEKSAAERESAAGERTLSLLEDETKEEETARELEARMIGGKIRELAGRQRIWDRDRNCYRPADFGDMVILLRTVSGWADVFARVLGEMGIPVSAGARSGYFSAPEIQTVLALLKVIDNPCQDIPLTAVLYSPIGRVTAEELARIRSGAPGRPFYQACMESERLKSFFEMLAGFRSRAAYMPMQDFLRMLLEETGFGIYAAAMPGGAQRSANLDMLLEKAAAYENGSYHGPYHFVRYIENLHKYEIDFGEAETGAETGNQVRILSVHKSKGLEFPIVFAAGLGKQLNQMDTRSFLILDAELGAGCDRVDPEKRTRGITLLKNYMKLRLTRENLGEELRVLYVALTRAREKLILTGTVKDAEKQMKKWRTAGKGAGGALTYTEKMKAKTWLDWVMPALLSLQADDPVRIRLLSLTDLVKTEKNRTTEFAVREEELLSLSPDQVFDPGARQRLRSDLEYRYPWQAAREIPSKISVSELKKMSLTEPEESHLQWYQEPVPVPLIPEFLKEEKEVSGAGRGTVYHKMMECMDFCGQPEAELRRIVKEGLLTEEEAELIDLSKIQAFLETELAGRMARAQRAGTLRREQQFVLAVPAVEIRPEWEGGETVLVQGIIDAYFIEQGEIVLVDYKTDSVKFQEASSLYEKYRVQLDYYKKALEQLTGDRVKEQLIYSFCLNREIRGA